MKIKEAVNLLNAIRGNEPESDHSRADDILLECVHPEIRKAYEKLVDRAKWWATA